MGEASTTKLFMSPIFISHLHKPFALVASNTAHTCGQARATHCSPSQAMHYILPHERCTAAYHTSDALQPTTQTMHCNPGSAGRRHPHKPAANTHSTLQSQHIANDTLQSPQSHTHTHTQRHTQTCTSTHTHCTAPPL